MSVRTLTVVLLACLVAVSAWAQPRTAPAEAGPKPAMIVGGHTLAPAVWAEGLQGDTVSVDGVEMMWVGAAAKASGGTARLETGPEATILHIRSGIRTLEFVIMQPGEFWRHPWVRGLIAANSVYQLQSLPYWPYEEANYPSQPPYGFNWKRPYLEWKRDEAWLLLNLEPPPPEEPEILDLGAAEAAEGAAAAPGIPTPPGGPATGIGAPPSPPPGDMMGAEPPPGGDMMGAEPPPD